jgi:hypothetical protein
VSAVGVGDVSGAADIAVWPVEGVDGMKVAISGAGVAGPSLAHWLHRAGHEPTLIERAPHFRTGGYVIDFWGVGYRVAQRMGIEAAVRDAGYQVQSIRSVGPDGQVRASLGVEALRRAAGGRFTSVPRGDLAAAIYATIADDVETIFGDSITAVNEHPDGVCVSFAQAKTRDFDLVIGADGYRPRDELAYVTHSQPGRSVGRFSLRRDRAMFLFVFRSHQAADPGERPRVRRCCAASSATRAGNARKSWPRSTVSTICTSMSSARSAWIAGRGAEPHSSATPRPVSR